jgi:hypothetical protein
MKSFSCRFHSGLTQPRHTFFDRISGGIPVPATRTKTIVTKKRTRADARLAGNLEDQVRTRAFEIFQARIQTNASGDQLSDWLQAERELNRHSTLART